MATQLITPNEAIGGSPGEETSVLRFGKHSSRLIVANSLIPKLFDEVSEGVRALPRGGAEIGGLLVGPKDQEGGVLADDIIPIPIEYRFGPSFRLSSPDLTKIEEAIVTAHRDLSKTVVGFYRSRTRGGAEFRDSDQEILLAVELAHAGFATDFHYYLVLSPPQRSEMPLGLALRTGMDWSEFRPYTCHSNPLGITSDLGDEPEPIEEIAAETGAPTSLEEELAAANVPEFVAAHTEEAAAEPESLDADSHAMVMAEPEATGNGENQEAHHSVPSAEAETMNVHSEESVLVETEALHGDSHDSAKADMEEPAGTGHTRARKTTTKSAGTGAKKAKVPKADTTTPRPRAKKATTTAKTKAARATAPADGTVRVAHAESKTKPHVTAASLAVVAEPKLMLPQEPNPAAEQLAKMRTQMEQIQWSKLTSRVSRQHILWAAGVVAVFALATSGYFLFAKHATTPVVTPVHPAAVAPVAKQTLALTAERHGTDLVLSWNRESPTVTHATYGMLIIRAKDGRRDIALTPDQLKAGSIVYTPTSDQVEVELSVVVGEQVTKDSVIVFLPRKGDKGAIVTTAQTLDTPPSAGALEASSAQLNEREGPHRASSSPPGHELKPFSMPTTPAGPETAGLVHLDELPPSLAQRPGQTAGVISLPSPQMPVAPQSTAGPEVVAQNKASDKAVTSSVIVAAVATEQVLPHVPENMKGLLTAARTIEVTVSIDENGKVVKAEPATQSHSDARLIAAALEAARRWKFQPARVNSRPVASEMIVKFNFAPVQ